MDVVSPTAKSAHSLVIPVNADPDIRLCVDSDYKRDALFFAFPSLLPPVKGPHLRGRLRKRSSGRQFSRQRLPASSLVKLQISSEDSEIPSHARPTPAS